VEIANPAEQPCLTVSQLTHLLSEVIEQAIPHVVFTGEISQFTRARSGHLYFTVRDADNQMPSVMWQGMARGLDFTPQTGDQVVCYGRPTFYGRGGKLQIVVHKLLPVGDGQLQKRFERLKAKLEKEGLFDESRKRPLPFLPRAVGIVTSKSGAAVHDIMTRVRDRMPCQRVYLYDAKVQGDGAAEQIVQGIEEFQKSGLVDVIIVGRGGGSLEDLWAFNEEIVVRAIFSSQVPVISAVGHEVDVTLSDMVADVRAPTPTAAGEIVVPSREDLFEKIGGLQDRLFDLDGWFYPRQQQFDELSIALEQGVTRLLQESKLVVDRLEAQVRTLRPDRLLEEFCSRVSSMEMRLRIAVEHGVFSRRNELDRRMASLRQAFPLERIRRHQERLAGIEQRLAAASLRQVQGRSERLTSVHERLVAVSPESIFARGFAHVTFAGKSVRDVSQVSVGDEVSIQVHKGRFDAAVKSCNSKK
jgi:exodeoxyribonuclease VII large subunit